MTRCKNCDVVAESATKTVEGLKKELLVERRTAEIVASQLNLLSGLDKKQILKDARKQAQDELMR